MVRKIFNLGSWSDLLKMVGAHDLTTYLRVYNIGDEDHYVLECRTYSDILFNKFVDSLNANGYSSTHWYDSKNCEYVVDVVM